MSLACCTTDLCNSPDRYYNTNNPIEKAMDVDVNRTPGNSGPRHGAFQGEGESNAAAAGARRAAGVIMVLGVMLAKYVKDY